MAPAQIKIKNHKNDVDEGGEDHFSASAIAKMWKCVNDDTTTTAEKSEI